jgi:hypothetical protein
VHDNINWSPETSSFTPDNAGMALFRVDATRAAAPKASASTSRSTRNFITMLLGQRCSLLFVDVYIKT